MTDNEKAATFIGWREGLKARKFMLSAEVVWGSCNPNDLRAELMPAPDMADPRNYMKALENVAQAGKDSDSMEAALTRTIINRDGGEIVAWLAALYDAERAS